MKLDKKDKDNTELIVKTGKKIIIALMFVIILLFISAVVVGIYNSEKRSKSETNINNSTTADNKTESKTEDKKENEETANIEGEKTITEDEKRYYEQAKPYIDTILNDFNTLNELAKQQNRDEAWKSEMSELAQKFIENGSVLKNLDGDKDIATIWNLGIQFGSYIEYSGEHLFNWLNTGNQEDFEDWKLFTYFANCYLQELNFYYIAGVTLQEQLENDVRAQVGEEFIDSITTSDGSNILGIFIRQEIIQDAELTKNLAYMEIWDLLKMMSNKSYYNYLDVIIKVQSTIQVNGEDKNFVFMNTEFKSETRKNIDFDNMSWSQIPNIADYYSDKI